MLTVRHSLAVLATALLGACAPSGSISGTVTADGAPVVDAPVLLQGGQKLVSGTTGPDGTFSFKNLDPQTYVVSVDVPATNEGHQQAVVAVDKSDVAVPTLQFTGTARITGTVTDAGAPVANAEVVLLGTQLSAVTDAQGAFQLDGAPSGTRTLSVTTGAAHGEAQITLARGDAQTVSIAMVADPPGTVTGTVAFRNGTDPSLIAVSAAGTTFTAQADAAGRFTLDLPPGTYNLGAQAPYHPQRIIGRVTVQSGQTVAIDDAFLSLYRDLPTFGIPGAAWTVDTMISVVDQKAAVLGLAAPGGSTSYYRFDLATHALTLLSVGVKPTLSPDGAWAAIPQSSSVWFVKPGTSDAFVAPFTGSFGSVWFSRDSDTAFVTTGGSPGQALWVRLATHAVTTLDNYESSKIGPDELLVRTSDTPHNWTLLTPGLLSSGAFTNVPGVQGKDNGDVGFWFGTEACASAPCQVMVLGPGGTQAVPVQGFTTSGTVGYVASQMPWAVLSDGGLRFLVNTSTGSATALLPGTANVNFSPDGQRLAFTAYGGTDFHEHPLPLPAILTPIATGAGFSGAWVGLTRFVGFNNAPTTGTAYRFVIDSGVLTEDHDYASGTGSTDTYSVGWNTSAGSPRVQVGMAAPISAPTGVTSPPARVAAQFHIISSQGALVVTRGATAAISWDGSNTTLYRPGAPPLQFYGVSLVSNLMVENILSARWGAASIGIDVTTGQQLGVTEPGLSPPVGQVATLSTTSKTFVLSRRLDASGNPVGGAYAFLPTLVL